MGVIVPAVLSPTREDLEEKLARLVGVADAVQVDVVDGTYAAPATWPYDGASEPLETLVERGELLPYAGQFRYEVDLMVSNPEEVAGTWIAAGATRIVAHVEGTPYLPRLIEDLRVTYGHEKGFAQHLLSFGLAIRPETELSLLEQYLDATDYVQFMGIKRIGVQGQPFDPAVLRKIRAFKKRHPDMPIQVDGGVTLETAPALLSAGVDRLVVGHAITAAADPKAEYAKFGELVERYGIYE